MTKTISIMTSVCVFLLIISPFASAELKDANCFDYYKFDGMKFTELFPDKAVYNQGEKVILNYKLDNQFGSPLVEGQIRAVVMYRGTEDIDRVDDDDILDIFYVKEDISMDVGDTYEGEFTWMIPKKARSGIYVVNTYYMVKSRFNIAGVSFMTPVPAKTTTFEVKADTQETLLLDKTETYLNGKKYQFRAFIPSFDAGTPVNLKTRITMPERKYVDILYELYSWDDTETKLDKYTKRETATSSKDLEYTLADLPVGVYMIKITATESDQKSILKVRFVMPGTKGKFSFLGIDHFPLNEGGNTTLFLCISNSAAGPGETHINFTGHGTVKVLDADSNVILEETYGPHSVTPAIDGKITSFIAPKSMTKLTLKADFYDDKDNLMDEIEIVYDTSKFLNIEKTLDLRIYKNNRESSTITTDDTLTYKLNYTDKYQNPVEG